MTTQVELTGDVQKANDEIILTFPENLGVIAVPASDCKVTANGIAVAVGTKVVIKSPPQSSEPGDLSRYTELVSGAGDSYACVGAQPWINLPGAFIDCTTGKVLGKCYQSFPCTTMK